MTYFMYTCIIASVFMGAVLNPRWRHWSPDEKLFCFDFQKIYYRRKKLLTFYPGLISPLAVIFFSYRRKRLISMHIYKKW